MSGLYSMSSWMFGCATVLLRSLLVVIVSSFSGLSTRSSDQRPQMVHSCRLSRAVEPQPLGDQGAGGGAELMEQVEPDAQHGGQIGPALPGELAHHRRQFLL